MRRKLVSAIILSIVILTVFPLIAGQKSPISTAYADEVKKLEVCGEAVVYVIPDVGVMHLGIQKKHKNLVIAQTEAVSVLSKLIQMLKNEDINENDIQSSNYTICPDYLYEQNTNSIAGYTVSIR